ncbi:propionyl-CoA carboxylase [bacterium]|nr:propionyl-CoA carboxylase [bacterium]
MGQWMDGYLAKLENNRQESINAGGESRLKVQRDLGKLTARERIDHLLDPGSFDEVGSLVRDTRPPYDGKLRPTPAEGVVMGYGEVDGRPVMVFSMDFTVMSGSLGDQAAWKIAELVEMAGQRRMPVIGIMDSAGERLGIKNGQTGLNGLSRLIRAYCLYSGVIPRIMLLLGPCTGTMAALPVLADFLIMNEQTGFLWLGGDIKTGEAGRAEFHMEKSGQVDLIAEDDADAIDKTKQLLAYLPQNCWEKAPWVDTKDDPDRREEGILAVMPDNPKFTYDIHEIIEKIVDNGEFFELQPDFATHLVTGFCRMAGEVVGVIANNPDELSGIFEIDSSDKYDRFMNFLDAFSIPLVNLVDSTAYVPGDKWERVGIIRHGAKNLHSYSHLTNQKVTIVLRRAYGGANIVMGCSRMQPDNIYGWPTAEFAPTGPDAVVQAVFHKELAKAKEAGNYQEVYDSYLNILKEHFSVMNAREWTSYYMIQEPIDPRDTRSKIIRTLKATRNKKEGLPDKKRYIKPA